MIKLRLLMAALITLSFLSTKAQQKLNYQKPGKDLLELIDAAPTPQVLVDEDLNYTLLLHRNSFKSIEEVAQREYRLAGLRINPANHGPSRASYSTGVTYRDLKTNKEYPIEGLPENARLSSFRFSKDRKHLALTNTTESSIELWVLNMETRKLTKMEGIELLGTMGSSYTWLSNNELLAKVLPANAPSLKSEYQTPTGPVVSESSGAKAQNRTYQDLLQNENDAHNFETLTTSKIVAVQLDGTVKPWMEEGMYSGMRVSPDGNYVMLSQIKRPFSYIVPYYRFPTDYVIHDKSGKALHTVANIPLTEVIPQGFDASRTGRRNIGWRSDKAASIYWVEALDGGDPKQKAEYRDQVYVLDAPFTDKPATLTRTKNRFRSITWGNDNIAVLRDRWWSNRNTKTYIFDPSADNAAPELIFDLNYQDLYANPGDFVSKRNEYGWQSLAIDGKRYLYLEGEGHSPEGNRPFLRRYDTRNGQQKELWRADGKATYERIIEVVNPAKRMMVTSVESKNENPNYYIRRGKKREQITFIPHPYAQFGKVTKKAIRYNRADGVELSATLYLPEGHETLEVEKLPMLMWAYPREFKSKKSAGQVSKSPHRFTRLYYGSPIYWAAKGYVVLDEAAFPIIGEGDAQPNDTFVEQLVANAKAGIDAVDAMGYIDRKRVAVGGHSYGAFMTANLLTHSDLFAAGIARSGAYNRTLTPFGFQAEERTYWEAPEIYYGMSPFMHAHKMDHPLLLIHGVADNNSGTYPMQSERYFNALKGLGKKARLVMLPAESHGYRSRESILHMFWEMDNWLEKYLNAGSDTNKSASK